MGLRAGLDWRGKSRPTGIRSPDRPARRQSLYRLRYPAHTTASTCNISLYEMSLLRNNLASECSQGRNWGEGRFVRPPWAADSVF